MDATTLTIVVSLVAVFIAAYSLWRASQAGTAITPELMTATLQASQSTAQELTEVALVGVQSAEQLWRSGKIAKSERFDKAFTYIRRWFPDLDQATIVAALEASVLVVNTLVESIPSKRAGGA